MGVSGSSCRNFSESQIKDLRDGFFCRPPSLSKSSLSSSSSWTSSPRILRNLLVCFSLNKLIDQSVDTMSYSWGSSCLLRLLAIYCSSDCMSKFFSVLILVILLSVDDVFLLCFPLTSCLSCWLSLVPSTWEVFLTFSSVRVLSISIGLQPDWGVVTSDSNVFLLADCIFNGVLNYSWFSLCCCISSCSVFESLLTFLTLLFGLQRLE